MNSGNIDFSIALDPAGPVLVAVVCFPPSKLKLVKVAFSIFVPRNAVPNIFPPFVNVEPNATVTKAVEVPRWDDVLMSGEPFLWAGVIHMNIVIESCRDRPSTTTRRALGLRKPSVSPTLGLG